MSVECTTLPGEPILLLRFVPPSEPMFEAQQMRFIFTHLPEAAVSIRYLILDFSQTQITFNDVIIGMREMAKAPLPPSLQTFHVGQSEMVKMIARTAMKQQYGRLDTQIFPTLDEALEHVRTLMRVAAK